MTKRKTIFALAVFSFAVGLSIPAQAGENDNDKGCPDGWKRVKVHKAKCEKEADKIDDWGNDDGVVCEKYKPGNLRYRDNKKNW